MTRKEVKSWRRPRLGGQGALEGRGVTGRAVGLEGKGPVSGQDESFWLD